MGVSVCAEDGVRGAGTYRITAVRMKRASWRGVQGGLSRARARIKQRRESGQTRRRKALDRRSSAKVRVVRDACDLVAPPFETGRLIRSARVATTNDKMDEVPLTQDLSV